MYKSKWFYIMCSWWYITFLLISSHKSKINDITLSYFIKLLINWFLNYKKIINYITTKSVFYVPLCTLVEDIPSPMLWNACCPPCLAATQHRQQTSSFHHESLWVCPRAQCWRIVIERRNANVSCDWDWPMSLYLHVNLA